jgi:hypothetical protein
MRHKTQKRVGRHSSISLEFPAPKENGGLDIAEPAVNLTPKRKPAAFSLERKLQLQLNYSRRRIRSQNRTEHRRWRRNGPYDLSEPGVRNIRNRSVEIGMVEYVEELCPNHEVHPLPDLRVLHDREVRIPVVWAADCVSPDVAERGW